MTSKFLKLFTLLIFASVLLVSCNKEEDVLPQTQTPVVENPTNNNDVDALVDPPNNNNSEQINAMVTATETEGCYTIAFPVTFVYEDGTTVTAETEADLENIFSDDAETYPWEIGFPVNLTDPETGATVTAENEEELFTYFMECEDFDDGDWDDEDGDNPCDNIDFDFGTFGCYELVFPISFELEDGSIVTADDENALGDLFLNSAPVDFSYPINLENEDGESLTANDEEELFALLEECEDFDGGGDWDDEDGDNPCDNIDFGFGTFGCYELVFPISFELEDGSIVTAADENALGDIFLNGAPVDFSYPINLENEDGENLTANDEEELFALLEECGDFDGGGNGGGGGDWNNSVVYPLTFMSIAINEPGAPVNCYAYVYPVSVTNEDGEVFTANTDEELFAALFADNEITDYVYPVSVTNNETGEVETANNEEEAIALVEACEG